MYWSLFIICSAVQMLLGICNNHVAVFQSVAGSASKLCKLQLGYVAAGHMGSVPLISGGISSNQRK